MKKQINPTIKAYLIRGAFYLLLLVAVCAIPFALAQRSFNGRTTPATQTGKSLSFVDRVAYQRAIEEVYWHHRIWPRENSKRKPALDEVMSARQIEKKVEDYLRYSEALEAYWQKPITSEQLQAEIERMARDTKQPEVLRELFEALGNDPFVIAECLARPVLTERLVVDLSARDKGQRFALLQTQAAGSKFSITLLGTATYTLPEIGPCTDDTWTPTSLTSAPDGRIGHAAVWTGSEMIVWGGFNGSTPYLNTGGRYNPSTDSWTSTSTLNAPDGRYEHTAVWTGSEMIIWGGVSNVTIFNTGGRYNPGTDTWTPTSTTGAPAAREIHTAVWTGNEMIVWGGQSGFNFFNTGGRYNPSTDSWTATSVTGAPTAREFHTAVWSGTRMIVWGGNNPFIPPNFFNTGGKYDPSTDSWTATSTTNVPGQRDSQTAVWTGNEMIVWGGYNGTMDLSTGGRYNPSTDNWTATSTAQAPAARTSHTAVWTGSEMIVWGGFNGTNEFNTGGRYNSGIDSWTVTSTTNAPVPRNEHKAVWTGDQMVVWGGQASGPVFLNTGGRYCAESGPTPTPTATATATATVSATTTPTPGPIQLRGQKKKVGGMNTVRLNWKGATSASIDVYRYDALIATTPNAPPFLYTDFTGDTGRAQYTYRVCEAGTTTCSSDLQVRFQE